MESVRLRRNSRILEKRKVEKTAGVVAGRGGDLRFAFAAKAGDHGKHLGQQGRFVALTLMAVQRLIG